MDDEQAVQANPRTIFQRWRDKLFSSKFPEHRAEFIEQGKGVGITTITNVFLDWPDRLRVLVGGILVVEVTSNTEHDPGKSECIAVVNIDAPGTKHGV